ncbi:hypothetical protein F1D05_23925 [Kribbella qitaiheensis]|uniref:Uncharacterized protein n=1 Tax=Kribbella qitaiheensis TaxID=1544730 RepID=A0A7G6X2D1_9ACTN|nr:hypothetical protein [Kribbella qitaiheensis]QNE20396.1 hypothetical protein F1D05_23925 [Kribbella qitaiheensis]
MLARGPGVTKVFTTLYGQAPDVSLNTANFIATEVNSAALKYGDSPNIEIKTSESMSPATPTAEPIRAHTIFTFNAYANSSEGAPTPGVGLVPDRIIVGDGVLDGFAQVGLADVTTQATIGHEFSSTRTGCSRPTCRRRKPPGVRN